ncbi:hypothetical protein RJ640_025404 [Escallonia rubra]|uniref:Mitochondrial import inner membrane translocase subunit Tim17/Tim22/Tim23 family protein n=1 Tax=Escallonia rubra TaxID=112253 RepID=A0AA88RVU0_9ASTE|nr:hypothetical protein RJ640_025404 [Escallonia rubra]
MNPTGKTQEESTSSAPESWKDRILIPTILAGVVGGAAGVVSKHRKVHGVANISATYATNLAIVTGCYCGAREFVRVSRASRPDDLLNSAIAGFGTGAILGRLQGGRTGAVRYAIIFSIAGTAADFATLKLKPMVEQLRESGVGEGEKSGKNDSWLKLPEWSPIKVLDEEALAKKRAQEQELYARTNIHNLNNEES